MAEENQTRRLADQGGLLITARSAQLASKTIFDWAEKRKIAAHIVMAVTVWLTIRIAEWAMDLHGVADTRFTGSDIALIQAAVLGPWGLMQGAMFTFYVNLVKNGG